METTKVFSNLLAAYINPAVRGILLRGGTRSSKTWSALQLVNTIAARSTGPRLISVVSETMPHLKRGAIRDFQRMQKDEGIWSENAWHDTDKTYSYKNGVIEFFSADTPAKVHGPARQVLYGNEVINWEYETYRQLAVRTTEKIILDYNPAFEFWADSKLIPRNDWVVIDSTYLDNDMLTAAQIAEIEANREVDPDWWNVYGLGLKGTKEGLVIKNWDIVNNVPPRSVWKGAWIGVDFGWSAPSAIMLVVLSEGQVWIDELGYGPNMDNADIASAIHNAGYSDLETICDKAEPKSIKDLKGHGIKAVESENKEIELGLQIMNRYKKHYTSRSLNSIQENRMYRRPALPEGGYGGKPIKKHGHAKDAERYVFLNRLSNIMPAGFSVTVGSSRR